MLNVQYIYEPHVSKIEYDIVVTREDKNAD